MTSEANTWLSITSGKAPHCTYRPATSLFRELYRNYFMKWKCFVSHHRSDTNTDQCTDQETVIHTKRVNRISPPKNGIRFGWTAKPKVDPLKTLSTCVNNALKQQKRKKKNGNDSRICRRRHRQRDYNMGEVRLEGWWLVGVISGWL